MVCDESLLNKFNIIRGESIDKINLSLHNIGVINIYKVLTIISSVLTHRQFECGAIGVVVSPERQLKKL